MPSELAVLRSYVATASPIHYSIYVHYLFRLEWLIKLAGQNEQKGEYNVLGIKCAGVSQISALASD